MASRAIVTRYADEVVLPTGDFQVSAYFLVVDPALAPGVPGQVRAATGIVLTASAPGTWVATIKAAVIAEAALGGFGDLTNGTVYIPTIA